MPELPDITVYVEALERHVLGRTLERVRIIKPFVLRSFDPPISEVSHLKVTSIGRIGKRLVLGLERELFIVTHLMIAGRLRWVAPDAKAPGRIGLDAESAGNGRTPPTGWLMLREMRRCVPFEPK